jgi:hypothetical protein
MALCKVKIPGCVQDILSISAYGRSTFYFHEALDAVALDSVWHLLSKLLDNRTAMGTKWTYFTLSKSQSLNKWRIKQSNKVFNSLFSIAVVLKTVLSTEDSVGNQRQIDHCNGHNYRYVGCGLVSKRGTDCCWLSERFLGFITMVLKNQRTDGPFSLSPPTPKTGMVVLWFWNDVKNWKQWCD